MGFEKKRQQEMGMQPISIFIPYFADAGNTNAQSLTIRQIMSRLDSQRFRLSSILISKVDPLLQDKANISYFRWTKKRNTLRFAWYLLKTQPDILFFPNKHWFEGVYLLLRAMRLIKTKVVTYVVHEINKKHCFNFPLSNIILRRLIFSNAALVGNSQHVAAGLKHIFNVESLIIMDGIDDRYFFPRTKRYEGAQRLLFLYAGSFQKNKRADFIIHLAAKYPNALFCLAGAGIEEQHCLELTESLGCLNVEFLGQLSQAELGEIMRRADLFLFPSISEGHPQVLGQATACGLPSIIMHGYNPHYLKHGETGFIAKTDQEFERYLHFLAHNESIRSAMSKAAIAHAAQFNWDDIVLQWARLFEQVMIAS
ncbi:MAG: glycosyltransferase family 4 protein [Legionella sp.]|nr:glycosyltransferase family 4 protein [Legionella sp.]